MWTYLSIQIELNHHIQKEHNKFKTERRELLQDNLFQKLNKK